MAKVRKPFVDGPDISDVIQLDLLEILFLVYFSMIDDVLIQFPIGFGRRQFLPVTQLETILLLVAQKPGAF